MEELQPIVINIDSIGGAVSSIFAYAELLSDATKSGRPIIININSSGATARSFADRTKFFWKAGEVK